MTAKSKTKRTKMKRSPQERIGLFIVHVICITAGVLLYRSFMYCLDLLLQKRSCLRDPSLLFLILFPLMRINISLQMEVFSEVC